MTDTPASPYAFFAAHLHFVARTTERVTPQVGAMMDELQRIGDAVAAGESFTVPADRLRLTARALAGLAGLLQQRVLPEVVAEGNARGERQIRWVIDTAMETMAALTTHAELTGDGQDKTIVLPPPPADPA